MKKLLEDLIEIHEQTFGLDDTIAQVLSGAFVGISKSAESLLIFSMLNVGEM